MILDNPQKGNRSGPSEMKKRVVIASLSPISENKEEKIKIGPTRKEKEN
jgi:hypothetical protein